MIDKSLFLFIFFPFIFSSCSDFKSEKEESRDALARVYDEYLFQSDIKEIVPQGTSTADSIKLVEKYINTWIREKLIVRKAEQNLNDEQKDVEKKLIDYRNSLITYAYEKKLVGQKLDTVVGDNEIEEYYNANKSNFELKDNIVKMIYIKVRKEAPGIEKLKKWYKSDDENDRVALQSYCYQYAENFYTDDNTWLLFNDLLKEVPIDAYNEELFLKNNRFVEVEDSVSLFLVNIKGFKIKNSISPLAFEKENIRNIILNKRKLLLINDMKQNVYQEALENTDFEIYNKNEK